MYLITKDYLRIIQPTELKQITSDDVSICQLVEGSVGIEMRGWLLQKFDLDDEFTSTDQFSMTVIYKGNNRVYLDAPAYNAAIQYLAANNTLVLNAGAVYKIAVDTPNPAGTFDPIKWTLLGQQFDLFYITLPNPLFNSSTFYYKGDKVWWKDKVYTAQKDSLPLDQQDALQADDIASINFNNPLPDDRFQGLKFWGTGVVYAVPVATLPTNTTYWTKGDNRNQQFVAMMMDMVVYELCKRIAPNNVPEARHNAWVRACNNLKAFADGKLNAQLPLIQPKTGNRVRFGGNPPRINSW